MKQPPKKPSPSGSGPEDENQFSFRRYFWITVLLIIGVVVLTQVLSSPMVTGEVPIPYSDLKQKVRAGEVERVALLDDYMVATPTDEALEVAQKEHEDIDFERWRSVKVRDDESLVPLLEEYDVEYEARYSEGCGDGSFVWFWLVGMIAVFLLWSMMLRRGGGGIGGPNPMMNFGRSKAKLSVEEGTGVTFHDVAGCDEAKEELKEIIDFLSSPEKFTRLGGKVPKGVLLVGPPGTGKTLLARAVAGEAGVPFFNLSGSDFVEMFVGVGAARVRDLFEQAQDHAPCIVFVDELDAIGKSRQGNALQSNEEREQTLNALLVEMDGFDPRSGVILLAATNRPEVLDQALLRPGRFDRQVVVDRPDVRGREAILKVHARQVVVADDVDYHVIAAQTPGFVVADLANVVNEAALLAARLEKDAVEMADFQEAIERVMAGLEKKSRRLTDKEKDIVAYHESGHAIVGAALDGTDRVHKVSIVSRGIAALGYTLQVPLEDRYLMTKSELYDKICGLLGGRAAEELVFGDVSTGAANDLQRVTDLAGRIVREYGMSQKLGNVSYGTGDEGGFLGQAGLSPRKFSEQTAVIIDDEVHRLIDELYERTKVILRTNAELLREMAEELKETEVLDGDELRAFLKRIQQPDETPAVTAPRLELPSPTTAEPDSDEPEEATGE
jgi:cell division protease FtsH